MAVARLNPRQLFATSKNTWYLTDFADNASCPRVSAWVFPGPESSQAGTRLSTKQFACRVAFADVQRDERCSSAMNLRRYGRCVYRAAKFGQDEVCGARYFSGVAADGSRGPGSAIGQARDRKIITGQMCISKCPLPTLTATPRNTSSRIKRYFLYSFSSCLGSSTKCA